MTDIIIPTIAILTNVCTTLIILFLSWIYYKWNEDMRLFSSLTILLIYQLSYSELSQESDILLGVFSIIIAWKITHHKCKEIAYNHQQKLLKEAMRDLEKYQREKIKRP